jgi:hypothetical protein
MGCYEVSDLWWTGLHEEKERMKDANEDVEEGWRDEGRTGKEEKRVGVGGLVATEIC